MFYIKLHLNLDGIITLNTVGICILIDMYNVQQSFIIPYSVKRPYILLKFHFIYTSLLFHTAASKIQIDNNPFNTYPIFPYCLRIKI